MSHRDLEPQQQWHSLGTPYRPAHTLAAGSVLQQLSRNFVIGAQNVPHNVPVCELRAICQPSWLECPGCPGSFVDNEGAWATWALKTRRVTHCSSASPDKSDCRACSCQVLVSKPRLVRWTWHCHSSGTQLTCSSPHSHCKVHTALMSPDLASNSEHSKARRICSFSSLLTRTANLEQQGSTLVNSCPPLRVLCLRGLKLDKAHEQKAQAT